MTRRAHAVALLWWLLIAALLRAWCLQRWSLWGDESHTLSDVLDLDRGELRDSLRLYPSFYFLEWCAMKALRSCEPELFLRIVPALAGTLAVGAFFHGSRGLVPTRERHLGAMVLCFSPWFLFHSQFARSYSLLLLFTVSFCLEFLHAVRADSPRRMSFAAVWLLLAATTHPVAALVLAGLVVSALVQRIACGRPTLRVLAIPLALVVLGLALAVVFLRGPIDRTIGFKLGLEDAAAGGIVDLVQGVVYNFGLAPTMLAAAGLLLLWRRRRPLALDVLLGIGLPFALLAFLAQRGVLIEQHYLVPCVPLMLLPMAAGAEIVRGLRVRLPRPLLCLGVLILLPFVPSLASHYMDGDRHDLRSVARFLADRVEPRDVVVSEYHSLMERYLTNLPDDRILEAPPAYGDAEDGMDFYRSFTQEMRRTGEGVVWACVPTHFERQRGDRRDFLRWLRSAGRLQLEVGRTRLDYHQNMLELYRVDVRLDVRQSRRWRPAADD